VLLSELGAAPGVASADLAIARDSEITLELVGRRTALQDPEAESKALFVETKRLVLSVLKVQSGQTLYKVLLEPVTDQDEMAWEEVVSLEVAADRARQRGQRPPPPVGHSTAKLQDVRRLSFVDLKAHTLQNMLKLEQIGKVSRANEFQDMLNAIAIDIRNKHRKRIQRANEKAAMHQTLNNLAEKKSYLQEQIQSYNNYIDASMQTMQKKGRKKFVLPFTQQYFHLRNLKASGKVPKFGSYKYTAQRLHEKGVLLSIDNFSSRQYEQISLTISSDEAGLFTIDASVLGVSGGSCDLRIEDLLEAQFNNQQSLTLMDGMAKVNLNLLIHLINKSE
jgi:Ras GTPase-activating-like protein IQGAP2/3